MLVPSLGVRARGRLAIRPVAVASSGSTACWRFRGCAWSGLLESTGRLAMDLHAYRKQTCCRRIIPIRVLWDNPALSLSHLCDQQHCVGLNADWSQRFVDKLLVKQLEKRGTEMQKRTDAAENFSIISLRRHYTQPHKYYNALRSHDNIYFDVSGQCWLVTGYSPVTAILDDSRFSSGLGDSANTLMASIRKQMLFMDGEEHFQAQRVILQPLARLVKHMPEEIRAFAQSVIETKKQDGRMDMVSDYASVISLLTIARVLGIPVEDRERLSQLECWSDTFGDFTSGYVRGNMQDISQLENYFRNL